MKVRVAHRRQRRFQDEESAEEHDRLLYWEAITENQF
jgi:hypothetical protein